MKIDGTAHWCPRCEKPTALRMWRYDLEEFDEPFCPQCAWRATPENFREARRGELIGQLGKIIDELGTLTDA